MRLYDGAVVDPVINEKYKIPSDGRTSSGFGTFRTWHD
jgi:hypothetical protein